MASGSRIIEPMLVKTFLAGAALSAHRIVIWHASTAETVIAPAAAPDTQMVGVTLAAAASGADVEVCMFGPCLLTVDGNAANIAAGDLIEVHSTGGYGGKRATTDGTTYREILGFALEASTADNDEIAVFVNPFGTFTA